MPIKLNYAEAQKKFLFTCITYFCVIAAYTLIKELQNTIFIKTVGVSFIPIAKSATIVILIPAILVYSLIVDKLKRFHIVLFYTSFYAITIILFGLIIHYKGIENVPSVIGWVFYFLIEGFSPFIVSMFWSFFNSITTSQDAKKQYFMIVASGKLGGALSAITGWFVLSNLVNITYAESLIPKIMYISGLLLLASAPFAYYIDQKAHHQELKVPTKDKTGIWIGFKLILKNRYVLAIFAVIFYYEVLNQMLGYRRLLAASQLGGDSNELASVLFLQLFYLHFFGLIVALTGTNFIFRWFSQKVCILAMPVLVGAIVLIYIIWPDTIIFAYLSVHILAICLAWPVRETLYIITNKDIQFKSKSWIDGFGTKIAKTFGQQVNLFFNFLERWGSSTLSALSYNSFLIGLMIVWLGTSVFLGDTYNAAVKKKI